MVCRLAARRAAQACLIRAACATFCGSSEAARESGEMPAEGLGAAWCCCRGVWCAPESCSMPPPLELALSCLCT